MSDINKLGFESIDFKRNIRNSDTLASSRTFAQGPAVPTGDGQAVTATQGTREIIQVDYLADTNQTLTGLASIDFSILNDEDSILLTSQTDPVENGIYTYLSGDDWIIQDVDFEKSPFILIGNGNSYNSTIWQVTGFTGDTEAVVDFLQIVGSPAMISIKRTLTSAELLNAHLAPIDIITFPVGVTPAFFSDGFFRYVAGTIAYDIIPSPNLTLFDGVSTLSVTVPTPVVMNTLNNFSINTALTPTLTISNQEGATLRFDINNQVLSGNGEFNLTIPFYLF